MHKVDIVIVGQGIAGSVLAHVALQRGLSIAVIDAPMEGRSTYVAGGLINPVTGRRVKKSWNYDVFYDKLIKTYKEIDQLLGVETFHQMPIHRLLASMEDVNNWEVQRLDEEYKDYMQPVQFDLDKRLVPHKGVGIIQKGGWLDTVLFLNSFKEYLKENAVFWEEVFDYSALEKNRYKSIQFDKIVFCEGFRVKDNPFFPDVNLWSTKGETLILEMTGDDLTYILNKNMLIIPMGGNKYKVGATLERNEDASITERGRQELMEKIETVIQAPYSILQQDAGIRPNVRDRKPLLGVSKQFDNYFLFNGLGSKGVSLAPYFAEHLLHHIFDKSEILAEVNWQRIFK